MRFCILTAGDPEGALLPVERVELQVHGAGQGEGDPAMAEHTKLPRIIMITE